MFYALSFIAVMTVLLQVTLIQNPSILFLKLQRVPFVIISQDSKVNINWCRKFIFFAVDRALLVVTRVGLPSVALGQDLF